MACAQLCTMNKEPLSVASRELQWSGPSPPIMLQWRRVSFGSSRNHRMSELDEDSWIVFRLLIGTWRPRVGGAGQDPIYSDRVRTKLLPSSCHN